MRYALISDIHANLPALEAVLAHIAKHAPDTSIYHLGDLVGYAPWPNEVVAKLRDWGIPGVAGNYDSTVAAGYKHCGCKYEDPRQEELSHVSYAWTLEHTTDATKRWLGRLPFRIDLRPLGGHTAGPTIVLLHGNHVLNTVYVHEERSDDFLEQMGAAVGAKRGDVICFGHTHKPWHHEVSGVHYVNTGSVGRPKDGDPRAGYVLLEVATRDAVDVQFVRVAYEVNQTASAIAPAGLPHELADYLRNGGPSGSRSSHSGSQSR
jgi:predicted phosphodiesterase